MSAQAVHEDHQVLVVSRFAALVNNQRFFKQSFGILGFDKRTSYHAFHRTTPDRKDRCAPCCP